MERIRTKPKFEAFGSSSGDGGAGDYTRWARFIRSKTLDDVVPCQVGDTNIFVGSLASAMNVPELDRLGITTILTIGDNLLKDPIDDPSSEIYRAAQPHFKRAVLRLFDSSDEVLFDGSLELAMCFIHEALLRDEKVLVHCEQGISRSSAVVCAFLIDYGHYGFEHAIELVRESRPQVRPNLNFVTQLRRRAKIRNCTTAKDSDNGAKSLCDSGIA